MHKTSPSQYTDKQVALLLRQLDSEDPNTRIKAIQKLGESGNEVCLSELRRRMKSVHDEYLALIIAVGNLKKALGVR